ncbi:MAG: Na+/H+ antiporter subunit E [Elusimicrobiota bacterium]
MLILALVLFAFWVVLSGKLDAFHLCLGALSAASVAFATRRLGRLRPPIEPFYVRTWTRWPVYLSWLVWQIVLSAVQVAAIVLHPKMPIDPRLVRFTCRLPNTVAHLTLTNSITLTPGTVTLDQEGDAYTVHALTPAAGESLKPKEGEGEMPRRVARLFAARGEDA